RRAALLGAREHDPDLVAATLPMERRGVEIADQPGAEHRDLVGLHRVVLLQLAGTGWDVSRPRTRSRPATRAPSFAVARWRAVWGSSRSRDGRRAGPDGRRARSPR